MIYELPGQIKKLNRLREMATILMKNEVIYTSGKLSAMYPVALISRLLGYEEKLPEEKTRAYLIRKTIEELGTTYIKFGQWLSVRPDFVPPDVLRELEKLQDRLAPVRFEIIQRTIEEETGKSLNQLFLQFDRDPLSTASIAQVHRGVLRTGEEVAVKVQRPNLKRLITVDIKILRSMAKWAVTKWPHLALHRLDDAISTFEAMLMDEINFIVEANNQGRMAKMFKDISWVRIPRVHWDYTTERLLVMEYLHGLKLAQKDLFPEWGLDPKLLVRRISICLFRQIFEYGFFQSDPHPGNILFLENNKIGLVDFGIIEKFDKILLNKLLDWIYAAVNRDVNLFAETFLSVGRPLAPIDKIQFRNDSVDYIDEIYYQPAERISFARLVEISNHLQYRHKIATPPTFLSIFKTISTMEGFARQLDPEFDWRKHWGPRLKKIIQARYSPEAILEKYWEVLNDYNRLMVEYPEDFRDVIKKIKEERFKAEMYMPELKGYVAEIRTALHKLSVSMIAAAVIFGLFYLGRGSTYGFGFFGDLVSHWKDIVWVIVLLLAIAWYVRRPVKGAN